MNKDPYATAEDSASVMAKNVTPERKAAIERLEEMIGERGLDEQGVSVQAYARGLYDIALELAERARIAQKSPEESLNHLAALHKHEGAALAEANSKEDHALWEKVAIASISGLTSWKDGPESLADDACDIADAFMA